MKAVWSLPEYALESCIPVEQPRPQHFLLLSVAFRLDFLSTKQKTATHTHRHTTRSSQVISHCSRRERWRTSNTCKREKNTKYKVKKKHKNKNWEMENEGMGAFDRRRADNERKWGVWISTTKKMNEHWKQRPHTPTWEQQNNNKNTKMTHNQSKGSEWLWVVYGRGYPVISVYPNPLTGFFWSPEPRVPDQWFAPS